LLNQLDRLSARRGQSRGGAGRVDLGCGRSCSSQSLNSRHAQLKQKQNKTDKSFLRKDLKTMKNNVSQIQTHYLKIKISGNLTRLK
jgi:hypothetical protein